MHGIIKKVNLMLQECSAKKRLTYELQYTFTSYCKILCGVHMQIRTIHTQMLTCKI
jgi:hypothetical protein